MRRRVYEWLEPGDQSSRAEKIVDWLMLALIIISVTAVMLESMPEMAGHEFLFGELERWVVYIFTLEYVLRIWVAPEAGKYGEGWRARWRYARSMMALVDLAAVLPFYVSSLAGSNTVVFRLLRIFRLVRVLKIGRYHTSMSLLGRVMMLRKAELMVSLGLVMALVVIASTLMYAVEHDAQPAAFPSIPGAIWWGIVTMTTVGYGDVYPMTAGGKVVAGISVLLGVGLFALPAGILASGFQEEIAREKKEMAGVKRCPHCGEVIEE